MNDTKPHQKWAKKGDRNRRRRAAQAACANQNISPGAVRTYVYLLTQYSDDLGKVSWPSQQRIANELGVTQRTICRHVKELEKAKLWKVERGAVMHDRNTHKVRRAHTNRYKFVVPRGTPNRKKPSNLRQDIPVAQNHITTLCKNKTFRVTHEHDPNCQICGGDEAYYDPGSGVWVQCQGKQVVR